MEARTVFRGFLIVFLSIACAQTAQEETCFDELDNCENTLKLNDGFCTRFRNYAGVNCRRTCKFCTTMAPPTTTPTTTTTAPTTPTTTAPTTLVPLVVSCKNLWGDVKCASYDPLTCPQYVGFYSERCSQFCGYCDPDAVTSGFHGKCMYKEKIYKHGETWYDGCDYKCVCKDGRTGEVECTNRCPAYYNVPPQCTFVKEKGDCCLRPVCNFGGIVHIKTVIGKGKDGDGNAVCMHNGTPYEQGDLVQDDCTSTCQCTDAARGNITCHGTCPTYDPSSLPPTCSMHKDPGTCCDYPKCQFKSLVGVFAGTGTTSGPGIDRKVYDPKAIRECKDLDPKCHKYPKSDCNGTTERYMTDKCPVYCGACHKKYAKPGPKEEDKCYHQGVSYKTGEIWEIDCERECICDDELYGYYHCYSKCPHYKTLPTGCSLTKTSGSSCCPEMVCDADRNMTFSTINILNIGGGDHVTRKYSDGKRQPVLPPVLDDGTVDPSWVDPTGIVGCLHNGRLLVQGEIAPSYNCSDVCQCVNEHLGKMICYDRCSEYEIDDECSMVRDTIDACCMVPSCPDHSRNNTKKITKKGKTVISKVVGPDPNNLIKQTNYTVKTTATPGSTKPTTLPESANPPPTTNHTINANDSSCSYNKKVYKPGERWIVGCDFNCLCIGGSNGHVCLDRCKQFVCPDGAVCTAYEDKHFPCCTLLQLDNATTPMTPSTNPATSTTTTKGPTTNMPTSTTTTSTTTTATTTTTTPTTTTTTPTTTTTTPTTTTTTPTTTTTTPTTTTTTPTTTTTTPTTTTTTPTTTTTTPTTTTTAAPTTPEWGTGEIPKGWLLLLKGVSGVSGDLLRLWKGNTVHRIHDIRTQVLTPDHPVHFKSVYAERFKQCHFEKIRMSIYRRGLEKARIIFNATNTNKTGWFQENRIESSSWSDLPAAASHPVHLKYEAPSVNRQFQVFKSSPSPCANVGWMFLSTSKGGCSYQTEDNHLHYSPLSGAVSYSKMEQGDVFAIMSKGGVCDTSNPLPPTCSHKQHIYLVGEKWQDGCDQKCHCSLVGANTAKVICEPLCEKFTNVHPGCQVVKKPGECCAALVGETCHNGHKCWDKFFKKTRAVGEVWRVECKLECDCTEKKNIGYVTTCVDICPKWDLTGYRNCVTPKPRPGKCCALPVCPGVEFDLPDKYKKDY